MAAMKPELAKVLFEAMFSGVHWLMNRSSWLSRKLTGAGVEVVGTQTGGEVHEIL